LAYYRTVMTGITQGIKSPRKIKPNDAEPVSTVERKFVRSIEQIQVSVDSTLRVFKEDGGAPRVVEGDIGREAGVAARLLDDLRRQVNWQDVNLSEANASRFTGVV
jgi:hypothetical protein